MGGALRSETSRPLNVQACLRATAAGALAGLVGGSYRWILDHIEPWRAERVAHLGGSVLGWIALAALFALGAGLASWLTVRFANFAEAMAEGRGKAQADTLRKARTETTANRIISGSGVSGLSRT